MIKRIFLAAFLYLAPALPAFCHDAGSEHGALREWRLNTHRHLHASFLMMRNDSVFLESSKGKIKVFRLEEFSKTDRAFLLAKKEAIEQLNRPMAPLPNPTSKTPSTNHIAESGNSPVFWILSFALFAVGLGLLSLRLRPFALKKTAIVLGALGGFILLAFKTESIRRLMGTDPLFIDSAFKPFKPNVATRWDADWFYVESKGIPTTHSMMTGITKWQQQVPIPQCYIGNNAWQIPLNPVLAAQPVPVNQEHFLRGAVAVAANGIPIFNPYTTSGINALQDGQLDQWGGHSGRADDYHYHIAPLHLDTQTTAILPIAFGLDGFAVYAGLEPDGAPMLPLDDNHGHFDATGVYHYHGTVEAPYMIGKMVGQVTEDAMQQIVPQPRANPVRPALTPLNGAVITAFSAKPAGNGYVLTYTRNGQTFKVDYDWTSGGKYTYRFISSTDTLVETYNGFVQCNITSASESPKDYAPGILLYPNPSSGEIFLKFENAVRANISTLTVFDMQGKPVYERSGAFSGPVESLGLPPLEKGVYLVKITLEGKENCRKIVIQ